ncbi:MAG: helix-turn-helix transcriptional regulator, partial [Clostridia bacterium]|nr:helix-turn-helix transcriptional regulator [Clostridia bacterium]
QDLRLEDVARFCGCSKSHLSHLFGRHMPMSFAAFVANVRIQHARRLLAEGANVSRTASLCGFSDPNYFATAFKRATGQTPTRFARNAVREEEGEDPWEK